MTTASISEDARKELESLKARGASADEFARAQLRVDQAQQTLRDTTRQAARAEDDYRAARQKGVDGVPSVVDAEKKASDARAEVAKALREKVQTEMDNMRRAMDARKDDGRNWAQSIIKGIGDGLSTLSDIMIAPFAWAVDAVRGFLGIASPSTVFAEIGRDLVAGLVSGITGAAEAITNAAVWIKDQVVSGVKSGAEAFQRLGGWVLGKIVDGLKTISEALSSVGGWLKNRVVEGVHAAAEGFKGLGGWVLNRIVEGFKVVGEMLGSVGGWLKNRVEEIVHRVPEGFKAIGGWVLNRVADGFTTVTDLLSSVGGWLKNRIVEIVEKVSGGFKGIGGSIMGWIVDGLKRGANQLVGFLNKILSLIEKIPGIEDGSLGRIPEFKIDKDARGGTFARTGSMPGATEAFAHGGAFARTGGFIDQPITLMGEEAPRAPEWVIPTNKAYRSRALDLWHAAGQSIGAPVQGLAKGGTFESTSYGPPWTGINGTGVTATGVDLRPARKAYGVAVDPNVIALGSRFPISPNPFGYSGDFKAFDTGSAIKGNRLDFYDWRGRAEQLGWGRRTVKVGDSSGGGGGGIGGAISGIVTGALGALIKNGPGAILNKLPGVGDLPDWLKGTGKYVLDKASDWIKDKVVGLVGASGGGGGGGGATGPAGGGGAGTFDGRPVAKWIIPILKWARSNGWGGSITSGVRTAAHNAAVGGAPGSNHLTTAYPGGAVDVGGWGARAEGQALASVLAGYEGPRKLVWAGPTIGDWGHFSTTGNKMGGVFGTNTTGILGSFARGTDYVPRTGTYELHKGESVTPAGGNEALIASNDRLSATMERLLQSRHMDAVDALADHMGQRFGDDAQRRGQTAGNPNVTHKLY